MKKFGKIYIAAIVLLFLATLVTFTVDERQYAIVFRLGEIVSVKKDPGLYFKLPFVENVKHYEKRIVTLNWIKQIVLLPVKRKMSLSIFLLNGRLLNLLNTMWL